MEDRYQAPDVMARFNKIVLITLKAPRILKASIRVALVVGTALNVINQGKPMLEDSSLSVTQLLMDFIAPLCVSSYSAARNELALHEIEGKLKD